MTQVEVGTLATAVGAGGAVALGGAVTTGGAVMTGGAVTTAGAVTTGRAVAEGGAVAGSRGGTSSPGLVEAGAVEVGGEEPTGVPAGPPSWVQAARTPAAKIRVGGARRRSRFMMSVRCRVDAP